jgi:hypothetical protein
VTLYFDGEPEDLQAARRAAESLADLRRQQDGAELGIANEFSEVRISKVRTRNGERLLIESPKSGQWIALCPLELEALTWQSTKVFSAMVGKPFQPLIDEGDEA